MAAKSPIYVIPGEPAQVFLNQYTDSLKNMFAEAIRVHPNFCTFDRWVTTDYTGPYSEFKSGFLAYKA